MNPALRDFTNLVELLCTRYTSVEVTDATRTIPGRAKDYSTDPGRTAPKVVLVVGAAASRWSGLPLWSDLADKLIDAADGCMAKGLFVEECWRQLTAIAGPKPEVSTHKSRELLVQKTRLEDLCGVARRFAVLEDALLLVLKQAIDRTADVPPQLGYELLAHMLKHGFVDDILTFNFDRILDRAIELELGKTGFDTLISNHSPTILTERSLPRLIKLHGCISAPPTLRFTRSETAALPQETIRLLDHTVFGVPLAQDPSYPEGRSTRAVHLITLGYAWNDADFAQWATARRDLFQQVLVVKRSPSTPELLRGLPHRVLAMEELCRSKAEVKAELDHLLWALSDHVETELSKRRIPFVPAARHVLLGYLFGPAAVRGQANNQHNSKNRFLAELLLHLVKCKGLATSSVMAQDSRIQTYFRRLDGDPIALLGKGVGRSLFPDVREAYVANADFDDLFTNYAKFDTPVVGEPLLKSDRLILRRRSGRRFLNEQLDRICDGPETEVEHQEDPETGWLFRTATPLRRYFTFQSFTRHLLAAEWKYLLVVAESGAWLSSFKAELASRRKRKVLLLTASYATIDRWKRRRDPSSVVTGLRDSVDVVVGELPWWQHNRHMTIALSASQCIGAVYFQRRLKVSRIHPLCLDGTNDKDAQELVVTFLSYVARAREADLEKCKDLVAASINVGELLQRWWPKEDRLSAVCARLRGDMISN